MVSDENAEALQVQGQNTIITSVKTIFLYLLKKWWLYFIVGLLAGLGGYFYAASQKPLYKSKLTFALDDGGGGGISGFASLASQFGLNLGIGKSEAFHLFARHTPVGIKIQHHGLTACLCDARLQFSDIFYACELQGSRRS